MKSTLAIATLLASLAFSAAANAGEPSGGWSLWPGICLHPPCCACCDDYCPKPLPCTAPFCCFGCDDYCGKPLPTVTPFCCFGCDDYCPKPCVVVAPLCCGPNYTCGPAPRCNPSQSWNQPTLSHPSFQSNCGCLPNQPAPPAK
ncbi:MAG TPA: hypothetical protein VHX65_02900 [Pirellulales bacterium]|nr:hypothetical protein [Pirellulales bacterium]